MTNKIKLFFDASVLSSGAIKSCFRTGIYISTMNILKNLVKNEKFDITLFCEYKNLAKLEMAIENDFQNYSFNIQSDVPNNLLTKIYNYFLKNRTIAKGKKKKFKKFIMDLCVRVLKLPQFLQSKFYYNKLTKLENKIDVYFSMMNKIPEPFFSMNIKKYVFLHDAIPSVLPEYHHDSKKGSWYLQLVDTLNSNDFYFTNSEYTRNDFLKLFPVINPNHISTTLLACNEMFKQEDKEKVRIIKQKYNIPLDAKYIFSLCTLEPRKNLIRAVRTFITFIKNENINDLVFVLGGSHWKEFIKILENEITDLGQFKDKILRIGYVDDVDLPALYSGAEWFVYTSMYEGFGLPTLEAMSCGCPVIASNSTSIPEVVGDAGIMIDWDSDIQHIEAYKTYYYNENLKKENSQKGLTRAKEFSWEKCTNQIIAKIINNK